MREGHINSPVEIRMGFWLQRVLKSQDPLTCTRTCSSSSYVGQLWQWNQIYMV